MIKNNIKQYIVAVLVLVGVSAYAQEQDREWTLRVAPYAWLTEMKGDAGVPGMSSSVDQSLSDILDNLQIAGMLNIDINNDLFGVMGDMVYAKLRDSQHTDVGKVTVDIEQWNVTLVPYVRIFEKNGIKLNLGAGGRFMDTDIDMKIDENKGSESKNWIDPLILAKLYVPVSENFYVNLTGDVGGFGVESDLIWELVGVAGYSVTKKIDLLFGYRYQYVDFQDDSYKYDMTTKGFLLGLSTVF